MGALWSCGNIKMETLIIQNTWLCSTEDDEIVGVAYRRRRYVQGGIESQLQMWCPTLPDSNICWLLLVYNPQ